MVTSPFKADELNHKNSPIGPNKQVKHNITDGSPD